MRFVYCMVCITIHYFFNNLGDIKNFFSIIINTHQYIVIIIIINNAKLFNRRIL